MEPGGSGPITAPVVVALAIISFLLFNVVSNSSLGRKSEGHLRVQGCASITAACSLSLTFVFYLVLSASVYSA